MLVINYAHEDLIKIQVRVGPMDLSRNSNMYCRRRVLDARMRSIIVVRGGYLKQVTDIRSI